MAHVNFFLDSVIGCYTTPPNSTFYGPGTAHPLGFSLENLCYLLFKVDWNYPKFASNLEASYAYYRIADWYYDFPMPRPPNQEIVKSGSFGSNVDGSSGYGYLIPDETYIMCSSTIGTGSGNDEVTASIGLTINIFSGGYKVEDLYYPNMSFELICDQEHFGQRVAYFNSTRTNQQIEDEIDYLNSIQYYHYPCVDQPQEILPLQEFQFSTITVSIPGGFTFPVNGYILPSYTMEQYTEPIWEDPGACAGELGTYYFDYTSSCSVSSASITTGGTWPYSD